MKKLIHSLLTVAILAALSFTFATTANAASLTARPQMAIGFDDVPLAPGPLLVILAQKHVKAEFFMVGYLVDADPALALSVAVAGQPIGNHSYNHDDFAGVSASVVTSDVTHAQNAIHAATGVWPHWYREPFLSWNDVYTTLLPSLGLKLAPVDINPKDWSGVSSQYIIDTVRDQAFAGAIVELHDQDDDTNTVDALPGLIDGLHQDGYDLVTLDELGYGAIEGTATEKAGPTLSGVQVTAYDSTGTAVETTLTGPSGFYRLAQLKPGTYRVGCTLAGHVPRYYDGGADLAHATGIVVDPDYTIVGADVTLQLTDTTAPSTSLIPTPSAGWINQTFPFILTASDAATGSGVAATYYRLDAAAPETYTVPATVTSEGTTTIRYWSVDFDGNVEASKTASVKIDLTPPHTADNSSAGWHVGPANVSLSASDTLSGVGATYYQLNGGATTTYTAPVSVSVDGTNTLSYWSVDAAGNAEGAENATVLVDHTPPHTTDNAPGGWHQGPVSVSLAASDALSGVSHTFYRLNGGATTTYTVPVSVSVDGTNTISYWSTDAVGNVEGTESATAFIDHTAPHTTDNAPGGWHQGPVGVTLTPSDPLSGVSHTFYQLNGGATTTYTAPVSVSVDGTNTLSYWSVDAAGNTEGAENATVFIDHTAPHTTDNAPGGWHQGPVGVTLTGSDALSGVSHTFYRLNGGATTTYTVPVSVSLDGTNTISYWSTDNVGNAEGAENATVLIDHTAPHTTDNAPGGWHQGPVGVTLTPSDPLSGVSHTFYQLNGGATTTYTVPVSVSLDGTNTISYWSTDNVGNVESAESSTVFIDHTSPHTTDNAPNGWRQGPVGVSLVASDALSGVSSSFYRLNGGATTTYTVPISVSGDGTNTISYWSVDAAGNVEGAKNATVLIDHTVPHTADNAPGGWQKSDVNVTLVPSDSLSGVSATFYQVNGGVTTPYSGPISVAAEGTNTISYWSTDNVGNVETTESATVRIDKTRPHTADDAPGGWHKGPVPVTLTPSDTLSGVSSTFFRLNGGAITTYTAPVSASTDGTNTIVYWSVDNAGNAETTATTTVLIDHTAPDTTDDAPASWQNTDVSVSLSASDALSGLSATFYRLNGGAATHYVAPISVTAEGANTIAYWSTDLAGNIEATNAATVRIDKTPPQTTDNAPSGWQKSDVSVTLLRSDALSGVSATHYRINGGATATYTVPVAVTGEGTSTIEYWSTDPAGNVEATQSSGSIQIDKTAPQLTLDAVADYITSATIHASASDALSGLVQVQMRLDSGSWSSASQISMSGVGTHTVEARAFDVAGNQSTVSATFHFIELDVLAPTTTLHSSPVSPGAGWTNGDVAVGLTATDNPGGSGVEGTYYTLDGVFGSFTTTFTLSTDGDHTFEYWSVDASSNAETTKSATFKVDKTAPLLSLDASPTYLSTATVEATASDAMSGLGSVEMKLDSDAWSGVTQVSTSVIGTHTVYARAFDVAGNEQDTSATVVVLAPPPPPPVPVTKATVTKISGPSSVKAKKLFKLAGTLTPASAPGKITITRWRLVGKKWKRIGSVKVSVASGRFSWWYKTSTKGRWHFVASYSGAVVGMTTFKASTSTKAVTIR